MEVGNVPDTSLWILQSTATLARCEHPEGKRAGVFRILNIARNIALPLMCKPRPRITLQWRTHDVLHRCFHAMNIVWTIKSDAGRRTRRHQKVNPTSDRLQHDSYSSLVSVWVRMQWEVTPSRKSGSCINSCPQHHHVTSISSALRLPHAPLRIYHQIYCGDPVMHA